MFAIKTFAPNNNAIKNMMKSTTAVIIDDKLYLNKTK